MKNGVLRTLAFVLIFRPITRIIIGLNIRSIENLPKAGPAILVANHNSHLDTIVLMCLFPMGTLARVRPVAAADYFLCNRYLKWFCNRVLKIIPIRRSITIMPGASETGSDPLQPVSDALREGSIVIYFPEGTRGEPESMGRFKTGIARLASRHPEVPIVPIYLHGLGKSLPKGDPVLVPFQADVSIGAAILWSGNPQSFVQHIRDQISLLASKVKAPAWS